MTWLPAFPAVTSQRLVQSAPAARRSTYGRLNYYAGLGQYPMNGPVKIRVTGPDQTSDALAAASVRPEWSKAWGCTSSAPWTSTGILSGTIPAAVSAGQAGGGGWSAAVSILSSYDPHAVFSNPFLDQLLR
jgi:cholesterol oxidase-like protein